MHVRRCSAKFKCQSTCKDGAVLHGFPADITVKEKWLLAMKRANACTQDWRPSKRSKLCSRHFIPSDYTGDITKHKVLKKDSVPSIFAISSVFSSVSSPAAKNISDCPPKDYQQGTVNVTALNNLMPSTTRPPRLLLPKTTEMTTGHSLQKIPTSDVQHLATFVQDEVVLIKQEVEEDETPINMTELCKVVYEDSDLQQGTHADSADVEDEVSEPLQVAEVVIGKENEESRVLPTEEKKIVPATKALPTFKAFGPNNVICIVANVDGKQTTSIVPITNWHPQPKPIKPSNLEEERRSPKESQITKRTVPSQRLSYSRNIDSNTVEENHRKHVNSKLDAARSAIEQSDRDMRIEKKKLKRLKEKMSKLKNLVLRLRRKIAFFERSKASDTDTVDQDETDLDESLSDSSSNYSNLASDSDDSSSIEDSIRPKAVKKYSQPRSIEGDMEDTKEKDTLIFRYKCKRVDGGYECNLCKKFCKGKLSIFTHIKKECQFPHFVCPICNTQFNNVTNIKRHLTTHSTSRNHICKTCNMAFTNRTNLRAHRRMHSGRYHKCTECDAEYRHAASLYFHMKKKHGELRMMEQIEYEHVCEICNERFKFVQHLKFHMERHSGIIHTCDQCGKEFTNAISLKSHFTRRMCSKGKSEGASVSNDQFADDSDSFDTEEVLQSQKTNSASSSSNADSSVPSQSSNLTKNKDAIAQHSNVKEKTTLCTSCNFSFADEVIEDHRRFCSEGLDSHLNEESSDLITTEETKRPADASNDKVTIEKQKEYFVKNQLLAECPSCKLLFVTDMMQEHQKLCSENLDSLLKEEPPIPHKRSKRTIKKHKETKKQKKTKKEKENTDELEDDGEKLSIDIKGLKNALGIDEKVGIKRGPDVTELALLDEVIEGKKRKRPWANKTKGLWQQLDPSEVEGDNPAAKDDLVFKYKCKRVGTKYVCNLCNAEFEGKRFFFSHALRDCPFPHYQCPVCNINYKTGSDLKGHLRFHAPARDFVCDTCAMSFKTQSALKTHLIIHSDEMPFKCTECDYACKRKDYLIAHGRKHKKIHLPDESKLKFMCHLCSRRYNSERRLILHMELHSGGNARYVCEKCGKAHATEQGLKMHLTRKFCEKVLSGSSKVLDEKKKEKYRQYAREARERQKNEPGKFQCDICMKSFSYISLLQSHYDSHNTEKNYHCNLCSKEFKLKKSLVRHIAATHCELKISCELCGRHFLHPSALRVHMQSHSNERPFVCQCGKSFKFKGDLNCHLKKCNEIVDKEEYLETPGRGIRYNSLVSNFSSPRKRVKRW